jgi:hypothetical protein
MITVFPLCSKGDQVVFANKKYAPHRNEGHFRLLAILKSLSLTNDIKIYKQPLTEKKLLILKLDLQYQLFYKKLGFLQFQT